MITVDSCSAIEVSLCLAQRSSTGLDYPTLPWPCRRACIWHLHTCRAKLAFVGCPRILTVVPSADLGTIGMTANVTKHEKCDDTDPQNRGNGVSAQTLARSDERAYFTGQPPDVSAEHPCSYHSLLTAFHSFLKSRPVNWLKVHCSRTRKNRVIASSYRTGQAAHCLLLLLKALSCCSWPHSTLWESFWVSK